MKAGGLVKRKRLFVERVRALNRCISELFNIAAFRPFIDFTPEDTKIADMEMPPYQLANIRVY